MRRLLACWRASESARSALDDSLRQPDGKLSPAAFSPVSRAAAAQLQTAAGGARGDAVAALPLPPAEPVTVFTLAWQQQLTTGDPQRRIVAQLSMSRLSKRNFSSTKYCNDVTSGCVATFILRELFAPVAGQRFDTAHEAHDADGTPLLCIHSSGLRRCIVFRVHDSTVRKPLCKVVCRHTCAYHPVQ